jgi:hypothetical protein
VLVRLDLISIVLHTSGDDFSVGQYLIDRYAIINTSPPPISIITIIIMIITIITARTLSLMPRFD